MAMLRGEQLLWSRIFTSKLVDRLSYASMKSSRAGWFSSTAWCRNPRCFGKGRIVPSVSFPEFLPYFVLKGIRERRLPFLEGVDIMGGLPALCRSACE